MSTENARPQEATDGRTDTQTDTDTAGRRENDTETATGKHPLGDAIAENAPYARENARTNNTRPNGRDTQ